jgi:hypothetical protein
MGEAMGKAMTELLKKKFRIRKQKAHGHDPEHG